MNQIMLMLGLDARGLFGNLKRGSDAVQGFEKDWKGIQKFFGAGGLTMLVTGFFNAMVTHARAAKGELSANEAAVIRFGAALDDGKKGAADWGVAILGWLNRFGETIGEQHVKVREFWKMMWKESSASPGGGVSGRQIVDFAKQADTIAKNRSKAAENADAQERQTAAFKKKFGEESARLTTQMEASEKRRFEITTKSLTVQEQVNVRENALNKLLAERETMTGTVLEKRAKDLEISEARNTLLAAEVELVKEKDAASKKAAEELQRAFEEDAEWAIKRVAAEKELADLKRKALPEAEQITAMAAEQLDLEARIVREKALGNETMGLETELAQLLLDLAEKRKAAEERTKKIMEGQAEAARMTQKAYESIIFGITNGGHSSQQIEGAEAGALKELLRRNNQQMLQVNSARYGVNPGGGVDIAEQFKLMRLQNENLRIQRELDLRNKISRDVGFLGVEGARRSFGGDPLVFDRLADEFASQQTEAKKTQLLLQDLIARIGPDDAGNLPSAVGTLTDRLTKGLDSIAARMADLRRN